MAEKIKLKLARKFDAKKNRHFINGFQTVFHCHHYTTLTTQLALDAGETELLSKVSEESFLKVLQGYYKTNKVTEVDARIDIACQYYAAIGMGTLELVYAGDDSGAIVSKDSHVENGWLKKWGKYDKPVNFIGQGYVKAIFSATFDLPAGSFNVSEITSIVKGDDSTLFKIYKK